VQRPDSKRVGSDAAVVVSSEQDVNSVSLAQLGLVNFEVAPDIVMAVATHVDEIAKGLHDRAPELVRRRGH